MLTRSGWAVAAGGVATVIAARLFGVAELFTLGAVALVLPLLALTWVRRPAPDLRADRTVHPRRVHLGGPSRVELQVANCSDRRSPVLQLHDPVQGTVGARVALAPMAPGEVQEAGYRLPTDRRGLLHIGPLRAEVRDPFGLACRRVPVSEAATLTVLPAVDLLPGVPMGGGPDDPLAGQARRATGGGADDIATLRPYVVGDDLRRVHWPSTARTGDLLVRQEDARWQGHVTVVLDTRADHIDAAAFEPAVSAAASVAHAVGRSGDRIRLLATDGSDSGLVDARAAADTVLEWLALAVRCVGGHLPVTPRADRRHRGTLVVVTGRLTAGDRSVLAGEQAAYAAVVVVAVSAADPADVGDPPVGAELVVVDPAHPFGPAWAAALVRMDRRR